MGEDEVAVADSKLCVKGFDRHSVADCSVIPSLVSRNTNLPAIMIAERASEMILAQWR